ncbi:MAG: class I SAM-dependent methyltransferase [Terriglobales bacterium]
MLQKVRNLMHTGNGSNGGAAPAPARAVVSASNGGSLALASPASAGMRRHSNGLREFLASWEHAQDGRVLDLGCTSSSNLAYFVDHGHGVYTDDLLLEVERPQYQPRPAPEAAPGTPAPGFDAALWLRENLVFGPEHFDSVLLWDLVDYLPEPLVKPLLERLSAILKPGGTVLAYFHTRDAGPDAPFFRYHIHDRDTLELRPGRPYRLQRIFNNRHVENLFRGYRSIKFFLARDNLREVLAVK